MVKIEDKTTKRFGRRVEDALKLILSVMPKESLSGIDKILLLDECPDKEFKYAGGFYCMAHNGQSAYVELYPPKILNAMPFFLPRLKFFVNFSIIKMFLHELGHHTYGIENRQEREIEAQRYMIRHLKNLYGKWIYFFDFMGIIDDFFRKKRDQSHFS